MSTAPTENSMQINADQSKIDRHLSPRLPLVVFDDRAYRALLNHGKESLENEICGVLVGEVDEDEKITIHVRAIIAGVGAEEGRIQVTFTQETWNFIFQVMEEEFPTLEIVGWYHSHPGYGVEFSDMDLFVQESFFCLPTQIAFLVDPLSDQVAISANVGDERVLLEQFWVEGLEISCARSEDTSTASELDLQVDRLLKELERERDLDPETIDGRIREAGQAPLDAKAYLIRSPVSGIDRVFPTVSLGLYGRGAVPHNASSTDTEARNILQLARLPLPFRHRFSKTRLSFPRWIGRLLQLHRSAMAAELQSQWERADIFLQTLHDDLTRWDQHRPSNESDAGKPMIPLLQDPPRLLNLLICEIFLQTHIAFYNGEVQRPEPLHDQSRAFVHVHYIERLLQIGRFSDHHFRYFLGPPSQLQVKLLVRARKPKRAERLCSTTLRRCPELPELQSELALLFLRKTLKALKPRFFKEDPSRQLEFLSRGIQRLSALRDSCPENPAVCDSLACLHTLAAKKLLRLNHQAEALVEAQKASVYREIAMRAPAELDRFELMEQRRRAKSRNPDPVATQDAALPCLKPIRRSSRRAFPWLQWWFSGQDKLIKSQALFAVFLTLATAGLTAYEVETRKIRQVQYQKLLTASQEQDYQEALQAAEEFLSRPLIIPKEPYNSQVRELYHEVFVRWFVEQANPLNAEAQKQIERFRAAGLESGSAKR